jgi:succinoglycan biosynthesis transport protein ExoP
VLGPQDRLKMLQRTYSQLASVYSNDHPDVLRIRREIEALTESTGVQGFDRETLRTELAAREDQLAAARDRYSADHPDVLRLERSVEGLREAVRTAPAARHSPPSPPDNPAYIQRQVQLRAAETELAAAIERRNQLRERLTDLEGRLTVSPEVEREFSNLNRGHAQLVAQYDEVQRKLGEAQMTLNLETEGTGERFTVLSAPTLPSRPSQPNRLAILLLTMVAAFGLAAGGVALVEATDSTVRNSRDVLEHLEIPPLVAVPFIYTAADLQRRGRRRFVAVAASLVWLGIIGFMITNPA